MSLSSQQLLCHIPTHVGEAEVVALARVRSGIADAQLARFKRTNTGPEAICQMGLWHGSRRPNYFFQSLLWWG